MRVKQVMKRDVSFIVAARILFVLVREIKMWAILSEKTIK